METNFSLSESELITLEGLVSNREEWTLLKKFFRWEIAKFWDILRCTDPGDNNRVSTNHKLAVGVESSLGDIITHLESIHNARMNPEPKELPDVTAEMLQ